MLYFLPFLIRGWALFAYTSEVCGAFRKLGRWFRIVTLIPVSVGVFLTLSTPWTSAIFTINPETGYHNCALYQTIYFSTYFYIGASFVSLIVGWKGLRKRNRVGLFSCNTVLLLGIIFRKLFILCRFLFLEQHFVQFRYSLVILTAIVTVLNRSLYQSDR